MSCQYRKTRFDLAAQYIRGALSEADQEAFEAHYLGCEKCFSAVRFAEKVSVTMHHYGASIFAPAPARPVAATPDWLVKLKSELEDLYFAFSREWRTALPALAAYVLLAVALGFGYYKLTSSSQLAQERAFQVEQPGAMLPIGHTGLVQLRPLAWSSSEATEANKALSTRLAAAQVLYKNHNYFLAAKELAEIANEFPESVETHLYLGVSQLCTGHIAEGIESLQRVLELHPNHAATQWYLAQAYLVQGDSVEAQNWLTQLADQHDPKYSQGAHMLLKEIAKSAKQKK
jgi:tetratricopeptide (TPR) repeat protein